MKATKRLLVSTIGAIILTLLLFCNVSASTDDYEYYAYFNVQKQNITPVDITGQIDIYEYNGEYDEEYPLKLSKITATANGKTYKGVVKRNNKFYIKYSIDDYNQTVRIDATDELGYTYTEKYTVKNIPFKVGVNKFYYNTNYVTGKTVPYAYVTVFVGDSDKAYQAKASSSGHYKVKVPKQKTGTEIFVGAVSPKEFNSYKVIKTTQKRAKLNVNKVFKGNTLIKGTVTNVKKGDYIQINYNGKTYKRKITKDRSKYKFSIKVKKCSTGKNVTVKLYNSFKQRRAKVTKKVYSTHKIKLGMSIKTVKNSDWGEPDDTSVLSTSYGKFVTYSYYYNHGYDVTIIGFTNGKVTSISHA